MAAVSSGTEERLLFAEGMIGAAFVAGAVFQVVVVPVLMDGGGSTTQASAEAVLAGVVSELWIVLVGVVVLAAVIATIMAGVRGAVGVGAAVIGGVAVTETPFLAVLVLLAAWWTGYRGYRERHAR